jgi:hypothetical protein
LYILKILPPWPTRSQRKKTGPEESSLIRRAIQGNMGNRNSKPANEIKISKLLVIIYGSLAANIGEGIFVAAFFRPWELTLFTSLAY